MDMSGVATQMAREAGQNATGSGVSFFCSERSYKSLPDLKVATQFLWVLLWSALLPLTGKAALPEGTWKISGDVVDLGIEERGTTKNTLSFTGHYDNGRFLLDLTPIKSLDNIAESVGWDGESLYLIQRFPDMPGGQKRDRSLARIEPTVFSRYATDALISLLLGFADSNALEQLEGGKDIYILGEERKYPEEDNVFTVRHTANAVEIEATCPARKVELDGTTTPIKGFADHFTRWTHTSDLGPIVGTSHAKFHAEYKRFAPSNGKLFMGRHVKSEIVFDREEKTVTNFRPEIPETNLMVLDYSCRPMMYPLSRGLVDQDYRYTLTNHVWDFDRKVVVADFAAKKARFAQGNLPSMLNDTVREANSYNSSSAKRRKFVLFAVFALISVLPVVVLFRGTSKDQKQGTTTKKDHI
jgi:hypothetical protein